MFDFENKPHMPFGFRAWASDGKAKIVRQVAALPAYPEYAIRQPYDTQHAQQTEARMTSQTVILIIEDEEFLRSSLADYLEDHGYGVLTSPNAEDGLRQLKSERVDLCIVDMRLPDMNGNEFILRAYAHDTGLKFIIFTGSVEYSLPESLQEIGLHSADILFKPLTDMSLLLEKISEACAACPRAQSLST